MLRIELNEDEDLYLGVRLFLFKFGLTCDGLGPTVCGRAAAG